MSLNRTLERFFDEVRREAKRNPAFADRLDAVLGAHDSRRDVPDDVRADVVAEKPEEAVSGAVVAPELNPIGLMQREGADVLRAALDDPSVDMGALKALVEEHNLDPGGEAGAMDRDALVSHIVAHAQKRVERDRKLFDY